MDSLMTGNGARDQNIPRVLRKQRWQGRMNQTKNTGYVCIDELIPCVGVTIDNIARNVNAGIRQKNVKPPEMVHGPIDQRTNFLLAGHVSRDSDCIRIELLCQRDKAVLRPASQDLFHTMSRQFTSDGTTNAGAGSG